MIQHPRHHRIHHLFHALWAGVKGRVGRQNGRARLNQQLKVLHMDEIERRLARDENQPPAFLQHDVGGAQEHIVAVTVRNPSQRAHAARDNDHRVGGIGAAGKGRVHALEVVRDGARGQAQPPGQFLGNHRWRVAAQDNIDLVLAGIQVVEQPLGVERAAGSGNGDKYSQKQ